MTKPFFIIIFTICISLQTNAQNGFDITHDFCTDTGYSAGTVMSVYADTNAFIVLGLNSTDSISNQHTYLASFNYNGQINWTKNIYFPGKINAASSYNSIIKIENDKYAVVGVILDDDIVPNKTTLHPYYYIFNNAGDSIFYKSFITSLSKDFSSVLYDGSNIVTTGASILSNNPYTAVLSITKYDKLGNITWEKNYLKEINSVPKRVNILLSSDKQHYLLIGGMYDSILNKWSCAAMKLDSTGKIIWLKTLPKKYDSRYYADAVSNPSGGYYFVSSYSSLPENGGIQGSELYYGKLDENGDTVWTRRFVDNYGQVIGYQIRWSTDNKHLLINATGYISSVPLLIKVDTSGNLIWHRMIQHNFNFEHPWAAGPQNINCLTITPDERYLMGGYVGHKTGPEPGNLAWLVLADSNGCRYPNDPACWPVAVNELNSNQQDIKLYPNPTHNKLFIENAAKGSRVQLFDILGREVYDNTIQNNRHEINTADLPKGTYILQLTDTLGNKTSRKILKE